MIRLDQSLGGRFPDSPAGAPVSMLARILVCALSARYLELWKLSTAFLVRFLHNTTLVYRRSYEAQL